MNQKYITRSVPNTMEQLEKLTNTISNDHISYEPSEHKKKILYEFFNLLNDCKKTHNNDKKLEKFKILLNNIIFLDKYYFLFKNKKFRIAIVQKIKYFYKYDKNLYIYIPYIYVIFESIKKNKHF